MMLAMKQPIAGVAPASVREVTVMTVYPTLGATAAGHMMGRLCRMCTGYGFFSLGKVFALLLIPFAIGLFFFMLAPGVMRRYRLTNRRVILQKGWKGVDVRWVDFDRFDAMTSTCAPGRSGTRPAT